MLLLIKRSALRFGGFPDLPSFRQADDRSRRFLRAQVALVLYALLVATLFIPGTSPQDIQPRNSRFTTDELHELLGVETLDGTIIRGGTLIFHEEGKKRNAIWNTHATDLLQRGSGRNPGDYIAGPAIFVPDAEMES